MFSHCLKLSLVVALATAASVKNSDPLYTVLDESTDGIADCQGSFILSCNKIDLDLDLINSGKAILIPETETAYQKVGKADETEDAVSYTYKHGQLDVIITMDKESGEVTASFTAGKSFMFQG